MTTRFFAQLMASILITGPIYLPAFAQTAQGAADEAIEPADDQDTDAAANDESPANKPSTAPDKIRFAAIVQFATPGTDRIDAKKSRTPLNFQDPIYEGDRLRLARGAYTKLILKNDCILIVYGEAQVVAPNREKPWSIRSSGLRAICQGAGPQPIAYRGSVIDVANSEVLLNGNRMLVLRGSPKSRGLENPSALSMLTLAKGSWTPMTPAPTPAEVFKFNQSRPAPKESLALKQPEEAKSPAAPATTRLMLGPVFGTGRFMHDHDAYSDSSIKLGGGRIQAHFQSGDRSFILAITPGFELDNNKSDGPCFGNNCPPAAGESMVSAELQALEMGMRFSHQRWWSPYWRGGLFFSNTRMTVRDLNGTFYNHRIEHYGITAAAGADAYWRPAWLSWFGVYANAEIVALRAIFTGADRDTSSCINCFPPPEKLGADPANPYTFAGLSLGFGIFGQW